MSKFTIGWLVWVLAGAVLETVALINPSFGDTLSEQIWWLLGLSPVIWFAGASAAGWAVWHLFFHKHD